MIHFPKQTHGRLGQASHRTTSDSGQDRLFHLRTSSTSLPKQCGLRLVNLPCASGSQLDLFWTRANKFRPVCSAAELDRPHGERYRELLGQSELNTTYLEKAETPYAWRN